MAVARSMKAVRIDAPLAGADAVLVDMDVPTAAPGWVLVQVKAFGLNDSERQLRHTEIEQAWIPKPIVPGVECAGVVADASDSDLAEGQRVIACMGGMGAAFDGSYAEYVLVPRAHVFAVPDDIPWSWEQLGAFPETYLTAWGSLFDCLLVQPSDRLLVRGATCALGYAAMQLAGALGARMVATTHKEEKLGLLDLRFVDQAIVDTGVLCDVLEPVDKVLELVGPRTLRDSLACTQAPAIVCSTGFLGGQIALDDFDPITDIPNGVQLTGYSSNSPTQDTYDEIFHFMTSFGLTPLVSGVYGFQEVARALSCQDEGFDGKLVVMV